MLDPLPDDPAGRGATLIAIARSAIAHARSDDAMEWREPWLRAHGASFVTLQLDGELRGCIGSIDPRRPLGDDVTANAYAAAYRDPRFAPVTPQEMPRLGVEVSVLSAREPLAVSSERDAAAVLRPGVDGVYLQYGMTAATFLPQVWESLPAPIDFLAQLRRKAGLPARFWHPDLRISRYTVDKFK